MELGAQSQRREQGDTVAGLRADHPEMGEGGPRRWPPAQLAPCCSGLGLLLPCQGLATIPSCPSLTLALQPPLSPHGSLPLGGRQPGRDRWHTRAHLLPLPGGLMAVTLASQESSVP